uniref:Uncharacterized protein n=1 Tax=Oryza glaberrima TaxID=4538 RepID=I1R8T0_ORYGL
ERANECDENERTNVNENKVNGREREHCRTNVNEPTNVNVKCNYRQVNERERTNVEKTLSESSLKSEL